MNADPPGMARKARTPRNPGFSLVEIMLALGIFSFCVVGIVYLLGSALGTSRDSAKDSSIAAALHSVDSSMRTISSGTLAGAVTSSGTSFYFDLFGNMLSGSGSGVYYTANVQAVNSGSLSAITGLTYPQYGNTVYSDSGTATPGRYFLWQVTFTYPANPNGTSVVIGESSYDPTLPHD